MTENDRPRSNNYGPLAILDRTLGRLVAAASILVLPVSLLLFLQWPLREWLLAYSREANDLAQVLFALYVSVAITIIRVVFMRLLKSSICRRQSVR